MQMDKRFWWSIGIIMLFVVVGSVLAFHYGWSITSVLILGKSLWEWLQLLIVPLVLALVAFLFQRVSARTERQIAEQRYKQDQQIAEQRYKQDQQIALDKQHEDLLQAYLDRMSELLLEKNLRTSPPQAEVRNVARVRTATVLCQLDAWRIGYVFAFLREAGLISSELGKSVISFKDADFRTVKWSRADLSGADLSGADLSGADLSFATLSRVCFNGADLSFATLSETDLSGANLCEATLGKANLTGANLTGATLAGAKLSGAKLTGATLREVDLSGANLQGANLSGAKIDKQSLYKARISLEQQGEIIIVP